MQPLLKAQVINPYKSLRPLGFYGPLGHRGVDLKYNLEELPSPITGKVVWTAKQNEMGNCMFVEDAAGCIHVFAHLSEFKKRLGDSVTRNEVIAITGNTGSKTTSPHLHWEIITPSPVNTLDRLRKRTLQQFKGYNTEPLTYLKKLYFKYQINLDGNPITSI